MPIGSTQNEVASQRILASGYLRAVDAVVTRAVELAMSGPVSEVVAADYFVEAEEPSICDSEDATLTYESQRDALIELLSDELAAFFDKYYPLQSDAFDEATSWLVNSITGGGTGIPPEVEEQIWQRGRDRVIADGMRAESQTLNDFASRGFSLPSGVMAARLQESRFAQLGKTQELSRDAAIKQADMSVENLRFAVEQAIKSRTAAMQAAADYIRSLMSGVDASVRLASINIDTKARMVSATADLYRARLARDELAMKIPLSNQDAALKSQGLNIDGYSKAASTAASAVEAEARAFAEGAKAALSAIAAVVSESTNTFE